MKLEMRICKILKGKESTGANSFPLEFKQKVINACKNIKCERLQNIYKRKLEDLCYMLEMK